MDRKDYLKRAFRRVARWLLWAGVVAVGGIIALLIAAYAIPLPDDDAGWSVEVDYRNGDPSHVFLSPDDKWRLPVDLDRVDPKFVAALVALEDKRFWDHHGVDPIAIARAAWTDVTRLHRVSGGSTLSMQLARLLEPRTRTIPHKLVDMFRAVQLDLRMSKRDILAHYLTRTPYGANVEGVESAAWAYFGHAARHLTPLEIATLLAVPQGPMRYAPKPTNTARLRARRDSILAKLMAAEVFAPGDAAQAQLDAAADAPPDHLRPLPREATHAALWLRARHPDELRIVSTLDAGLQALAERQVASRAPELQGKGIYGCAVVVVDHVTREVVALVGNLDRTDRAHGGEIEMFDRPRSPGSTLKPFLYALAIDRGIALPSYLVADVPSQYGSFRPRNFDNDWAGLVTLRDALSRSLNLPFVDLLQQLGVPAFLGELSAMGVSAARAAPGQYGLSLIIGGIEVTPLELAGLYATLAEGGAYRPLRLTAADAVVPPDAAFGRGAAWLTRDALSLKDRPDFPKRRTVDGVPAQIHWKTGTSFGFRDAWAAGSGPRYTAVVWTGNVDNKPSADLIGSEAAGPLLFDVLEGVADRAHPPAAEAPPDDLTEVEVCAYSGHIAGEACEHKVKVLAPVHAVPIAPCPFHEAYDVDRATGRAVLPACHATGHAYDRKTFTLLPSSVTAWLVAGNREVPEAPVFADGCAGDPGGSAPEIVTPGQGEVVTLLPGAPARSQVVALTVATRAHVVSWFVDGALLATAPAAERVFWQPTPGKHQIVVSDDAGRKATRALAVKVAASQRAGLR